jgi:hypothetical protein
MRSLFFLIIIFGLISCKNKIESAETTRIGECKMNVNGKDVSVKFFHQDTAVIFLLPGFDPEFRKVSRDSDQKVYTFSKGFVVDMTNEEEVKVFQISKDIKVDTVVVFDPETKKELMNTVESEVLDTLGSCNLGNFSRQ